MCLNHWSLALEVVLGEPRGALKVEASLIERLLGGQALKARV